MKQEDFQVVAELYRFLATFDPSAIEAASRLPSISDNLRTALTALHKETATRKSNAPGASAKPANSSPKGVGGGSRGPLALLLDNRRFPTKQHLVDVAKLLRMKVNVDAKASRERLARRLARAVEQDPGACERLYELVGATEDSQTAGWFDVIRRG